MRIVELDDDLDVGTEVGSGASDPELGALGLSANRVTQEVNEAPALQECAPDVVNFAPGSRYFIRGNSPQRLSLIHI